MHGLLTKGKVTMAAKILRKNRPILSLTAIQFWSMKDSVEDRQKEGRHEALRNVS